MADHQSEIEAFGSNDDFWLFGYGSLIWKPPPHYGMDFSFMLNEFSKKSWCFVK
ncbi:ChaC-domain-containing protein [Pyrenophora tritici-repentis]|uniref:Uncharacterized protein n=1 Tax=Pyrenophora tritici-repentis TaxID=45151 RepID=A0A834RQ66_9PLEO|nr:ChaC-domain-containing protein [Pyrenophora tritici-repentis]KAF7567614.1 hypothetical protein PtrM4_142050 [Pyrenophora tritici-repentis]KAI2479307.1 ChaC-domain-containing protein [Pyrenophora tritici-repentis]